MIEPPKPLVLTSKHFPVLLSKHLPRLFCFKTALRCAGKYQIPTFVDRARLGRVDIFAPFFDSLLGRHLVWTWKIQLSFLTNIMTKDNLFERLYVKLYWMLQGKLGYLITEISWQVGGIFYRESSKTTGFNSGSVLKSLWIERTIPW